MRRADRAVLLVEHDDATLALYQRALSREFRVVACQDGQDAPALLDDQEIGVVILEPGPLASQGWALMSAIQHVIGGRHIPIILCSTLDERKRGMELGACAYLIKPVLPAALLDTVRRILDQPR